MYKQLNSFQSQCSKVLPNTIVKFVLPATIFMLLLQIIGITQHIHFYNFVADPNEVNGLPPYTGMVSMIGIMFWCASAVICLASAFVLQKYRLYFKNQLRKQKNFFRFSGYLNLLLFSDDLFQIHEYYYRLFINLNSFENSKFIAHIFEGLFYIVYFLLIVWGWVRFKDVIKRSNYSILLLALGFLGASVMCDIFLPETMPFETGIEETLKLLGIVTWFNYFVNCCDQHIQDMITSILVSKDTYKIDRILDKHYQ